MEYTQIDKTVRLNAVKQRIRELEQQYLQLSLRVEAPDLSQPANEMDESNKNLLESSLEKLHQMEQELSSSSSTP